MDLKRARSVSQMRTQYLEALEHKPEASGEIGELTPKQRFDALALRVAAHVRHYSYSDSFPHYGDAVAPTIPIEKMPNNPLPNLSLRYTYNFRQVRENGPEAQLGERNEHGEYITSILVEWVHTPDGKYSDAYPSTNKTVRLPAVDPEDLARSTLLTGEIFAAEHVYRPNMSGFGPHPADIDGRLTVIEQSLDVYEPVLERLLAVMPREELSMR